MGKNVNIKKAFEQTEFTPEQVEEIRRCMYGHDNPETGKFESGPIYFAKNYVRIQHPKRGDIPFILYDYQERMMNMFLKNNKVIVLSARQTGKALSLDTEIPTPTGWTTMGDIQVGDWVLGADGKPTQVEAISNIMHNHTCYEVKVSTGQTVIADAEHLWEVRDEYTRKTKILTTQQMVDTKILNDNTQARYTIKTCKPLELDEAELPVDPYTLGAWLGGGNSCTGEIVFHEDDSFIVEQISSDLVYRNVSPDREHIKVTTIPNLRTGVRELGLLQNKHIPISYLRSSFNQRLALLQGVMDTDGTVDGLGRGQCQIVSANERLANDILELASTLGLNPTLSHRVVGEFERWEVNFSAYRSDIVVFRMPRKLKLLKDAPHTTHSQTTNKRSIVSIIEVESVPVKCIRVSNIDHLFLYGREMVPTHNSVTSSVFLLWFAIFNPNVTVLIAANRNANAMEMISRIGYAYEYLPMWMKPGVTDDGWNKHTLKFDNKSRIVSDATSANTGRGMSISLLYLDEFAFVAPNVQEEFWTSILPTLSTGGACIMTSTPNGSVDKFSSIWRASNHDSNTDGLTFKPIHVKWDEPPGRDEAFKASNIALLGDIKWKQEYECCAGDTEITLMDPDGNIITKTMGELYSEFGE